MNYLVTNTNTSKVDIRKRQACSLDVGESASHSIPAYDQLYFIEAPAHVIKYQLQDCHLAPLGVSAKWAISPRSPT